MIINDVLDSFGYETMITTGADGEHRWGSLHYVGQAVDIRKWAFKDDQDYDQILAQARECLGGEFDLVDEPTHWHLEYQPKTGS